MEQNYADPELEKGARKTTSIVQPEVMVERPRWRMLQECKEKPCKGLCPHWEAQWQDFLKGLDSSHAGWRKESSPWEDAKAFLASFEQVAKACQWPREKWAARLLPALSGEAQQAFGSLEARDREDYGKVKAAILRGEANRMETLRQHFRQFRFREVEDPRLIYSQLQELCHRWLRPERHSKEQILELLILEQFLAILPPELQRWIRAGSPENCTQAAVLMDDFLLNQQGVAKSRKRQEPMNLKETGVSLDVVEETLTQPNQRTIFWRVLQDSRNADALGIQKRRPLKVENSPCGRNEPQVTPGPNPEVTQGNLLAPDEIHKETREEKRSQIKIEEMQEGEMGPEEMQGMLAEVTQWNIPGTSEIQKQRCDSNWQQKKPTEQENEYGQHSEGISKTSPVHAEGKKPLFSKYGRKYRYKSGLLTVHTSENPFECPTLGKNTPQHQRIHLGERRYELSAYERRDGLIGHTTERPYQCYECGKSFNCRTSLDSHQGVHTEGRPYECSQCGKHFRHRQTLLKHQKIHTGEKLHKCPECGKVFTSKGELMRHQRIHTGEKPYKCLQCGKSFRQRVHLMSHHRTHTGEKPFMCLECGKNLHRRNKLIVHLETHRTQEHYECPECGKSFSQKAMLINHRSTHVGL
uniref:zinc finger protein 397-like n=1 Tax=Euleptes europaea TaxID=460621 RepID=UPI002541495F|nr:zinc finger protein 397-like [Euleptes europaea]